MSVEQLSIFDCDFSIQSNDFIFQRLKNLQEGQTMQVTDMQITRDAKFYIVRKEKQFEELFRDIHYCYKFINKNLFNDLEADGE
ncbi:hypothetical protein VYF65_004179 [Lysinibacillus irui]|uniref:hypothetical protein n=1 Tax=Lysinibacillus irui TaxID=2998077 RepID=UPI00388B11A4